MSEPVLPSAVDLALLRAIGVELVGTARAAFIDERRARAIAQEFSPGAGVVATALAHWRYRVSATSPAEQGGRGPTGDINGPCWLLVMDPLAGAPATQPLGLDTPGGPGRASAPNYFFILVDAERGNPVYGLSGRSGL